MAKRIVTQNPHKSKVKINPHVDAVSQSLSRDKKLYLKRSGEVLAMSNKEAIEFLRSVGFSQIVPGTHFAPARDFAEFFGVESVTLFGFINKHKIGVKGGHDEAFMTHLEQFFTDAGLNESGEVIRSAAESGVFDFHFTKSGIHYVTRNSAHKICMVSARVALSAIPFIADCRYERSYDKTKAKALNDELIKFLRQRREQEQAIAEAEAAARVAAEAKAQKEAELKASMAEETLYKLIKRAVVEVMSGAHISLAAPTVNT